MENSNSDFFLETNSQSKQGNSFFEMLRKIWNWIAYYSRQIWPYVNQLVTFLVYETTKVVKAIIRIALEQTGLRKE